jgi:hypothetical protein
MSTPPEWQVLSRGSRAIEPVCNQCACRVDSTVAITGLAEWSQAATNVFGRCTALKPEHHARQPGCSEPKTVLSRGILWQEPHPAADVFGRCEDRLAALLVDGVELRLKSPPNLTSRIGLRLATPRRRTDTRERASTQRV